MRTIDSCRAGARAACARLVPRGRSRRVIGPMTLIVLVLAFGLCAHALATPTTVSLHVKVVPIPVNPLKPGGPSYPGTGDILGKGASVEGDVQIHGDEYGGFPPPLTGVSVFAPPGLTLHPQGFPACPQPVLESHEVAKCPKHSSLTSVGSVSGVVSFGGTRVHEALTVQAFSATGGRIAFYAEGVSPAGSLCACTLRQRTANRPRRRCARGWVANTAVVRLASWAIGKYGRLRNG
jgi:hypothetical protein